MVNIKETHLTKKQLKVLKLRRDGRSLAEIAKMFGTSRSNISRISKIADNNVEKSKNTLALIGAVKWPIRLDVRAGANVYEVSERVFKKADEKKIRISQNYSELVEIITKSLGKKWIKRRKVMKKFTIMVSGEGKVEIA